MSNPKCFHISASSVATFKACPTRFRLGYREGLRLDTDTDSQRVGTNWHTLHEVYYNATKEIKANFTDWPPNEVREHALNEAMDHVNSRYADAPCPAHKTVEEWDVERHTLLISFIGYMWYWESDPIDTLMSELAFDLPLHNTIGLPLQTDEVLRVGKIDHIAEWQGNIVNVERKSTAISIDPSGSYWEKAQKDTQVSMYALAFQDMCRAGELPDTITGHSAFDLLDIGNTLYDVWHKPTTKPKKLTQAETKVFLETGVYQDATFSVSLTGEGESQSATVNGTRAEILVGKKAIALKETPDMYAARLLQDIYERPEFYFQRKEIARTEREVQQFRVELFNIYQAQRLYDKTACWFENEQQCRATFPCSYIPICYGRGANAVCDGETQVSGFKRIYTDLTLETQKLPEGD